MLNFSTLKIGLATFSLVPLPNAKHMWAVFVISRTQRTNCLLPTSSITLYGALEQIPSMPLLLVRNPSNATSQSLPSLPTRANNQSGIHITFTQTQKSSKKLSKLFYRTVLNPRHSAHQSLRITGWSILAMTGDYVTFWLLADWVLNSPLTKPFYAISMHHLRGARTISLNCSM